MKTRMFSRPGLGAIRLALVCLCLMSGWCRAQTAVASLGVGELDYFDTSGEVRDQQGDHARRLKAFTTALRTDLENSGKFHIVSLDCSPEVCSASISDPDKLIAAAEKAGAAYLLVGGIHKMSTLIQWAKFDIVAVATRNVAFDRLITFRGDDDAAWTNAEEFLVRDILAHGAFK